VRAFLSDLWSHRGFRYTFIVGLSVAASVTCFYWVLNWTGEKRWQRVKAKLEAEGETFDFYSLYPAPIPDEQNFCAIEPLKGIRTPEGTSTEAVAAQKKRDVILRQADLLTSDLCDAAYFDFLSRAKEPNFIAILNKLKETKVLKLKSDSATWAEVQTALETQAPILKVLGSTAKQRGGAIFTPCPSRADLPELVTSLSNPHFNPTFRLAGLLKFHSLICFKSGNFGAAMNDSLALLRLSQGAYNSNTMIANLIGNTLQMDFQQLVWLMLNSRQYDDAALAHVQEELLFSGSENACLKSFRAEMAIGVAAMEYLERYPDGRWVNTYKAFAQDMVPTKLAHRSALSQFIPSSFIIHSKAAVVEAQWQYMIRPLSENGFKDVSPNEKRFETYLVSISPWLNPDLAFVKWLMPPLLHIVPQCAIAENQRRQAVLACALERHFRRYGSYPETLQSLAAEYRGENDLFDVNGEVMRYALVPGGRFRLWSLGPDGKDDGGQFGMEIKTKARRPLNAWVPSYIGDWVWRYDPAVKVP
jgi:hypothetical protein